ncbi:PPE family protein [[Mycobacterium] nativiensis]|uniref:PPE family protein n=1 Tax=[Mycobacterium] nativiensis TaxID=2855503 RepID=A0ABU5XRD7_9MYCO|nr:PPE family protein [Mycolicibacter sp. MYC340]MEB3030508.1 PPE family protein [Mycolicibacter sp. MYC340]
MAGVDFGALPPEVNSARMYAGPGTGSLLAAAGSWRGLAGELGVAASSYQAVITDLTGQSWFGPASASMAAAATPYADWLGTTATLADQAASRLMLAVSDFEQTFAAMVPPPAIAVNRTRLAALVAANVFGQNAAEIAATEADYGQMWVQDAMAMYGYAARSAAATTMTPFTAPPAIANPAGSAGQVAAAGQAATGSAHNQLSQLLSAIPSQLQGLSTAGSAQAAPADPVSQAASYIETVARTILPANDANISALYGMGQYARNLNTDLDISQATGGQAGFGSGARALGAEESTVLRGAARPAVTASTGSADAVGRLAVPQAWADSVPEVTTTAMSPAAAVPPAGHGAGVAVAGLAGRSGGRRGRVESRSERTAGELLGTDEVRHWHAEPGELKSLLAEVAAQPGVHEVYFAGEEQPASYGGPSFGSASSGPAEPPENGPRG